MILSLSKPVTISSPTKTNPFDLLPRTIDYLPTMTLGELLSRKRVAILSGPMGTGKTTFQACLANYLLVSKPESPIFWLQPKTVVPYFVEALPPKLQDKIVVLSNPISDKIWYDDKGKTKEEFDYWLYLFKLGLFEEIANYADRFSNASSGTRVAGKLFGYSRQKNMFSLVVDQGIDIPVAAKEKSTLYIFTGIVDDVARRLQKGSTSGVRAWLDWNASMLIQLGEFNNENLKQNGWGIAIVTNASASKGTHFAKKIIFYRPWWYTRELSTALRYVRPSDVQATLETEDVQSYDTNSPAFKCLLFAWHYLKRRMIVSERRFGKIVNPTPEDLNADFIRVSPLFFNTRKSLPNKGRGKVKEAAAICGTEDCPWCKEPEEFKKLLKELNEQQNAYRKKIDPALEKEIDLLVEQTI